MNTLLIEYEEEVRVPVDFVRKIHELSGKIKVNFERLYDDKKKGRVYLVWENKETDFVSQLLDIAKEFFKNPLFEINTGKFVMANTESEAEAENTEVVDITEGEAEAENTEVVDTTEGELEAESTEVVDTNESEMEAESTEVVDTTESEAEAENTEAIEKNETESVSVKVTKCTERKEKKARKNKTNPKGNEVSEEEITEALRNILGPKMPENFREKSIVNTFCDSINIDNDILRCGIFYFNQAKELSALYQNIATELAIKSNPELIRLQMGRAIKNWLKKEYPDFVEKHPDITIKSFLNVFRNDVKKS